VGPGRRSGPQRPPQVRPERRDIPAHPRHSHRNHDSSLEHPRTAPALGLGVGGSPRQAEGGRRLAPESPPAHRQDVAGIHRAGGRARPRFAHEAELEDFRRGRGRLGGCDLAAGGHPHQQPGARHSCGRHQGGLKEVSNYFASTRQDWGHLLMRTFPD
jgi:hypothetical protein